MAFYCVLEISNIMNYLHYDPAVIQTPDTQTRHAKKRVDQTYLVGYISLMR